MTVSPTPPEIGMTEEKQNEWMTGSASFARSVLFDDDYRDTTCKIGQGAECCRYLTVGAGGWSCAKPTAMRHAIDNRLKDIKAKGDNCDGVYRPQPAFKLLRARFEVPEGATIYKATGYDYGLASDDARFTGVPHTSMTLNPSGDYPSFTVPNTDFAALALASTDRELEA